MTTSPANRPNPLPHSRLPRWLVVGLALSAAIWQSPAPADDEDLPPASPGDGEQESPALEIVRVDDQWLRLGDIRFRPDIGEIRFPAVVNQREDIIEYVIVHEDGKIHESLLTTTISPAHLHAVMLLLRYPLSRDEFQSYLERPPKNPDPEAWTPADPADEEMKAFRASRVRFFVRPSGEDRDQVGDDAAGNDAVEKERPLFDWVAYAGGQPDIDPLMTFTGSVEVPLGYSAEMSGSIAANYHDAGAMFNLIHPDAWDDLVWTPAADVVPEPGTPVEVVIRRPPGGEGRGVGDSLQ